MADLVYKNPIGADAVERIRDPIYFDEDGKVKTLVPILHEMKL